MKRERDNRNPGEIILSKEQKKVLFDSLITPISRDTMRELRGDVSKEMLDQNRVLRKLMKDLVIDLDIDIVKYIGSAESLLLTGFSECLTTEQLKEFRDTRPRTEEDFEVKWAGEVRHAAEYFLTNREAE